MSSCGLLFVFIYSSAAVFMIVSGQSTTDDSQDDVSIIDQLVRTVAILQAEVQMLEARQSSVQNGSNDVFSRKDSSYRVSIVTFALGRTV